MIITDYFLQQYDLPLCRTLTVGASKITTRTGIILTLKTDVGLTGYGEIAPLPGLHQETLSDVIKQLSMYQSQLSGISVSQDTLSFDGQISQVFSEDLFPSVRLGVEMAIFDLLLQLDTDSFSFTESIPINALLTADDQTVPEQVNQLLSQGFTSIKIKVARRSVDNDIQDIKNILSRIQGRALLRLDANRGWTLDQVKRFCEAVDPQGIEYIEEPTQNMADHAHLNFPIALDETLSEKPYDQLDPKCYRAVVLKPAVLGGLEKTAELIRWAQKNDLIIVLSSSFESSLTTRMYLYFAAVMGITQTPLGLDTGKYFLQDLLSVLLGVQQARISLPPLNERPVLRAEFLKSVEAK